MLCHGRDGSTCSEDKGSWDGGVLQYAHSLILTTQELKRAFGYKNQTTSIGIEQDGTTSWEKEAEVASIISKVLNKDQNGGRQIKKLTKNCIPVVLPTMHWPSKQATVGERSSSYQRIGSWIPD